MGKDDTRTTEIHITKAASMASQTTHFPYSIQRHLVGGPSLYLQVPMGVIDKWINQRKAWPIQHGGFPEYA